MTRDYHDFSDKSTPKEERRRLNIGGIYVNAAICGVCDDYIRSRNRHDFVRCSCGNVAVDGGSWYARRVFKTTNFEDVVEYYDDASGVEKA